MADWNIHISIHPYSKEESPILLSVSPFLCRPLTLIHCVWKPDEHCLVLLSPVGDVTFLTIWIHRADRALPENDSVSKQSPSSVYFHCCLQLYLLIIMLNSIQRVWIIASHRGSWRVCLVFLSLALFTAWFTHCHCSCLLSKLATVCCSQNTNYPLVANFIPFIKLGPNAKLFLTKFLFFNWVSSIFSSYNSCSKVYPLRKPQFSGQRSTFLLLWPAASRILPFKGRPLCFTFIPNHPCVSLRGLLDAPD